LFGTCLETNIMGPNPVIGSSIVPQAGIPMQIDFRDVYASVLKDWFNIPTLDIQSMFEHSVTFYNLIGGCNVGLNEDELAKDQALIYPNPSYGNSTIQFTCLNEWVKIDIYDSLGKSVAKVHDGNLSQGKHNIYMELGSLNPGQYIAQIRKESGTITENLVKVK